MQVIDQKPFLFLFSSFSCSLAFETHKPHCAFSGQFSYLSLSFSVFCHILEAIECVLLSPKRHVFVEHLFVLSLYSTNLLVPQIRFSLKACSNQFWPAKMILKTLRRSIYSVLSESLLLDIHECVPKMHSSSIVVNSVRHYL